MLKTIFHITSNAVERSHLIHYLSLLASSALFGGEMELCPSLREEQEQTIFHITSNAVERSHLIYWLSLLAASALFGGEMELCPSRREERRQ